MRECKYIVSWLKGDDGINKTVGWLGEKIKKRGINKPRLTLRLGDKH